MWLHHFILLQPIPPRSPSDARIMVIPSTAFPAAHGGMAPLFTMTVLCGNTLAIRRLFAAAAPGKGSRQDRMTDLVAQVNDCCLQLKRDYSRCDAA